MAQHELSGPASEVLFSVDYGRCWHKVALESAITLENIRWGWGGGGGARVGREGGGGVMFGDAGQQPPVRNQWQRNTDPFSPPNQPDANPPPQPQPRKPDQPQPNPNPPRNKPPTGSSPTASAPRSCCTARRAARAPAPAAATRPMTRARRSRG